jgi:hypothetical protein
MNDSEMKNLLVHNTLNKAFKLKGVLLTNEALKLRIHLFYDT